MRKLFDKVMENCDGAELYKKEEYITELSILNGKIRSVNGNKNVGISLRINKDGRNGSAVATTLEDDTLLERALLSSQYQKEETLQFRNLPIEDVSCFDEKVKQLTIEDLKNEGQRILEIFRKHDESIVPDVYITRKVQRVDLINSSGFDHGYEKTEYALDLETKSKEGFMEVSYEIIGADFKQISEEEIQEVIYKHRISQNRVKVETGKMPVVFSGAAMGALMTRLLSGVNGGNVMKKVSPLEGKIGHKIASENITIRDNGRRDFGKGSCPFDDEGCPTHNTMLVEEGVLKNYLVSFSQEEKLKLSATGNSFKRTMFSNDIEDQPSIDSTNFILEGKHVSDEELIKGIKKGIYIEGLMGTHTGNIPAGEYSLNIGCGYLIEDGRLTAKVMDAMVAGNIYEDLLKVEALGTKLEPMKVIFYTMGYSPAVLFKELSVVGS